MEVYIFKDDSGKGSWELFTKEMIDWTIIRSNGHEDVAENKKILEALLKIDYLNVKVDLGADIESKIILWPNKATVEFLETKDIIIAKLEIISSNGTIFIRDYGFPENDNPEYWDKIFREKIKEAAMKILVEAEKELTLLNKKIEIIQKLILGSEKNDEKTKMLKEAGENLNSFKEKIKTSRKLLIETTEG